MLIFTVQVNIESRFQQTTEQKQYKVALVFFHINCSKALCHRDAGHHLLLVSISPFDHQSAHGEIRE